MGSRADCIAREDFVVPPEFKHLELAASAAGRIGGARIELVRHKEETRLGGCYQQIPMRLMPPFSFDDEAAALLYLITLTAGLMDGDGHHVDLTARKGSRSVVTGQSATRVHPALVSYSTQQWNVAVEEDACLVVLPGPLIPFRGCRYFQRSRVELAPSAKFIWGDIWLPGRYERGAESELFVFDRIVQDLEVRRAGNLIFRDRYRWDGPWTDEEVAWYFGGQLCVGSLFISGPRPESLPNAPPGLHRSLFPFENGDLCIRWCGSPADVTNDLVITALRLAGFWTSGQGAPPWLLESSNLSPNHWFSPPQE